MNSDDWRAKIIGCGSYLPERILTNDDLSAMVDTSDEWISARTGIRQRHIAAEDETTSDLALKSAVNALEYANIPVNEIDLIIVATTTPDSTFPSTAVQVQAKLGLETGAAFDIQAVCSGFIYGLAVADSFIRLRQARTILLIGAETFSRIIDWEDRATCVLFGDGAGAVVLRGGDNDERGVLSSHLHSDGRLGDLLYTDGGPSSTQTVGHVRMAGREVFRQAVVRLAQVAEEALKANDLKCSDLDWLVPHQANIRIIEGATRKLGLPNERVVITVDRHANTSSASIPLALDEAVRDGRIQPGHLLLMEAMGGGMTWGASLVRW